MTIPGKISAGAKFCTSANDLPSPILVSCAGSETQECVSYDTFKEVMIIKDIQTLYKITCQFLVVLD